MAGPGRGERPGLAEWVGAPHCGPSWPLAVPETGRGGAELREAVSSSVSLVPPRRLLQPDPWDQSSPSRAVGLLKPRHPTSAEPCCEPHAHLSPLVGSRPPAPVPASPHPSPKPAPRSPLHSFCSQAFTPVLREPTAIPCLPPFPARLTWPCEAPCRGQALHKSPWTLRGLAGGAPGSPLVGPPLALGSDPDSAPECLGVGRELVG